MADNRTVKVALAIALALVAPTAASASVSQADLDRAVETAETYWSAEACPTSSRSIEWDTTNADPNTWLAMAAADSAPNGWRVDPYYWQDCIMVLNEVARERGNVWLNEPDHFCTVIVHEYGHWLGKPHSDDPNDVMYPQVTRVLPECDVTPDPQPVTEAPAPAPESSPTVEPQGVAPVPPTYRQPPLVELLRGEAMVQVRASVRDLFGSLTNRVARRARFRVRSCHLVALRRGHCYVRVVARGLRCSFRATVREVGAAGGEYELDAHRLRCG